MIGDMLRVGDQTVPDRGHEQPPGQPTIAIVPYIGKASNSVLSNPKTGERKEKMSAHRLFSGYISPLLVSRGKVFQSFGHPAIGIVPIPLNSALYYSCSGDHSLLPEAIPVLILTYDCQ